jgi:DNA-binding SARP family transcriptional activator
MRVQVLGALAACDGDTTVALPTALKARQVLALLVVRMGRPTSADVLATLLWGDRAPVSARRNVQLYVHQLRRALGADAIAGGNAGYQLDPGIGIDATRFTAACDQGAAALGRGEPEQAARHLREALALWRGDPFAELSECPALAAEAEALTVRWLAARERLAEADLAVGRHEAVAADLVDVVRDHPYRERLAGHLMVALHRCGRRAEALRVFRDIRAALHEQLAMEPSEELQRLHRALLADVPSSTAPIPPARQLPRGAEGFTGRADALATLDALADAPGRLLAIVGMAGVGKTALAVQWAARAADQFPDGQLYVDLQGFAPVPPLRPVDALAVLLRALGVPTALVPADQAEAAARFRSLLAGRRVLVLLDNTIDAEQVRPLLAGASAEGCTVVVTSRDRLTGLVARDGARRLRLNTLAPDESRSLLRNMLGADRVDAEPAAVDRLAEVCGHLPLALRIAGAQLADEPWRSVSDHATRLAQGDPVERLAIDGDTAVTIRTAFGLSYERQSPAARAMFRLLGVAPVRDVTAPAAAALAGIDAAEAATLLRRLAAAHLVDEHRSGRYAVHDLLRNYAAALARQTDDAAARESAVRRLLAHYAELVARAAALLISGAVPPSGGPAPSGAPGTAAEALAWQDDERANLVTAVRHAAAHGPRADAVRLALGLRPYFDRRRHMADWLAVGRAGVAASRRGGDREVEAATYVNLAWAHYGLARYRRCAALARRAIAVCAEIGSPGGEADARATLGFVLSLMGRCEESVRELRLAWTLRHRIGDVLGEAGTNNLLSHVYREVGDLEPAVHAAGEALRVFRAAGRPVGTANAATSLGEALVLRGDLDAARGHLLAAVDVHRQHGNRPGEAVALTCIALMYDRAGDADTACAKAQTAVAIAAEIGDAHVRAYAYSMLGVAQAHAGDRCGAERSYRLGLTIADQIGTPYPAAEALLGLATIRCADGDAAAAGALAERGFDIAAAAGYVRLREMAVELLDTTRVGPTLTG